MILERTSPEVHNLSVVLAQQCKKAKLYPKKFNPESAQGRTKEIAEKDQRVPQRYRVDGMQEISSLNVAHGCYVFVIVLYTFECPR